VDPTFQNKDDLDQISKYVEQELSKTYNNDWKCITGKSWNNVEIYSKEFAYFYIGNTYFLIYRTNL